MRMPKTPPDTGPIWQDLLKDRPQWWRIAALEPGPLVGGKYLHWDKLIRHAPPDGVTHPQWWASIKRNRRSLYKSIPQVDSKGDAFQYLLVDPIPQRLHEIDLGLGGSIRMSDLPITNRDTRDQYYVNSLMEEAITSSQLEGAATTRPVAREMIRTGRPPRDRSERMILNNFKTMRHISDLKERPLTPDMVFEIHRLVTDKALDDPTAAGRLRRPEEQVVIRDEYGEVFHQPPDADGLPHRLRLMCEFANASEPFVHPVIRSIIVHFWLAYDHPFVDGNGRTARALFYWSMLHHNYWLCEFISISHVILKAPVKYGRTFLHTETDDNDLTYFILYHLDVIHRAVQDLHRYIDRKTRQLQAVEIELRGVADLNHRQRALIGHALRHPNHRYTIESHRASHDVVHQTARTDLRNLVDRGLLTAAKRGKTWHFTPVADLERKLAATA